jgi:hypothetical protein
VKDKITTGPVILDGAKRLLLWRESQPVGRFVAGYSRLKWGRKRVFITS